MLAFFFILLIVALLVERWSLKHALNGVKYDVRLSKQLMEIGEKIDMITTLRMTERRFVPYLKLTEEVPTDFQVEAKRRVNGFDEKRSRISSSTYLMPRQKVTRRLAGAFPARGRYVFTGATMYGGDFLGLNEQVKYAVVLREAVVMPKPLAAPDVVDTLGGFLGDISVNRFIMEDPVLTLGFREYTGREPMKHISWPVSARMGELMVKNFDYTLELSVSVILNVDSASYGPEGLDLREKCFSLTRDVCEVLEEKRIKYAFYTNSVAAGMVGAWSYISEGLGGAHLMNILEGLGRCTQASLFRTPALIENAERRAEAGRAHVIVTPRRDDIDPRDIERLRARTGANVLVIAAEEVTAE